LPGEKSFMGRVADKVAIISGGASGLGLASARLLAKEGAKVVIADINREQGEAAAAELPGVHFEALDVTSEKQWVALVDKVVGKYGRLDILLNSAGVVRLASIEDTTEDMWRQINGVGTDGTFFGCKHALRVMKLAGSGSIINMCSTASIQGGPRIFAYAASKSAIRGMTKSVAVLSAQSGYGIRCNSIHPGNMQTPMLEGVQEIVRELVRVKPTFGICLGHQILGLALGGTTRKLKFGHHGGNQPGQDLATKKVAICAENHGFAVEEESLRDAGEPVEITHVNLNDGTVEGLRHRSLPAFSVQYHPEASPGPHDALYLFDDFVGLMDQVRGGDS